MKEYKVERDQWNMQPDPKKSQSTCDRMAADGWRLVAATAVTGSGGGSVLTFWERERS